MPQRTQTSRTADFTVMQRSNPLRARQDLACPLAAREPGGGCRGISAGLGVRRFFPGHNVRSPAEVDALLTHVAAFGAKVVKPAHATDWGGYAGYFTDLDGFLWEVDHNPGFPHV
jgi:hypothetical protein